MKILKQESTDRNPNLFSSPLSPIFIHMHILIICRFLICELASSLKCICNPKTSACQAFLVFHRLAIKWWKGCVAHIHLPSWGQMW